MRAVPPVAAVWLGKVIRLDGEPGKPALNGVMPLGGPGGTGMLAAFTGLIVGGPLIGGNEVPCALMVVPCGIDAIRVNVCPSCGSLVVGTITHSPGSK